ncbi:MAG: hypothetical protein WCO26_17575 [Deltaproteobacteria bacterium]
MIHVKEVFLDNQTVALDVGGVLDEGAIPVLKEVCELNLKAGRKVLINFASVIHITREGRKFVREIGEKVSMASLPEFMSPEFNSRKGLT